MYGIIAADSEKIVSKILDKYELVNENNWEYFGDLKTILQQYKINNLNQRQL